MDTTASTLSMPERRGEGVTFPPVVLFFDSTRYYMGDGFHRAQAAQRVGRAEVDADVPVT